MTVQFIMGIDIENNVLRKIPTTICSKIERRI